MELVFDNDALWFLVATDLLADFLQAIEVEAVACCRLPTSVFMLKGRMLEKLKGQYGNIDWTREEVVERVRQIPALEREPEDLGLIDQLSGIQGLDPGEVTLIEVVVKCECRLVTGDLRALTALSRVAKDLAINETLDFKIITLCRVIEVLVGSIGITPLQAKCEAAGVMNKSVKAILGSTFKAETGHVEEALESYLRSESSDFSFKLWVA